MTGGGSEAAIAKDRLLSLDFFRELTMFLLIGKSTLIYKHLVDPKLEGTPIHAIGVQSDYHPWNGLHFFPGKEGTSGNGKRRRSVSTKL